MKTETKVLVGIAGGMLVGGIAYWVYKKWTRGEVRIEGHQKEVKDKKEIQDEKYHEDIDIIRRAINEVEEEMKHEVAFFAYFFAQHLEDPKNNMDELLFKMKEECVELIVNRLKEVLISKYNYPKDKIDQLYDIFTHPDIQNLLNSYIKCIEQVVNKKKPELPLFKQCEIDPEAFISFLSILYLEFRYIYYLKVQDFISKFADIKDPNEIEKNTLENDMLMKIKEELWNKLKMPKFENLTAGVLIRNIISNYMLTNIEQSKKIKDIQNDHVEQHKNLIIKGTKIPDFENRKVHPIDEFISNFGEYPFKSKDSNSVNT